MVKPRRETALSLAVAGLGLLLAALGPVLAERYREAGLDLDARASGTVAGEERRVGATGLEQYLLAYVFETAEGALYCQSEPVPAGVEDPQGYCADQPMVPSTPRGNAALFAGDRVPVAYDPADPSHSLPLLRQGTPWGWWGGGLLLAALGLAGARVRRKIPPPAP